MSKSLQKGILFAVCILLVCALGVTLFIFDGTGGAVTGQEGQASAVAAENSYEHGNNIDRTVDGSYVEIGNAADLIAELTKDDSSERNIVLTSNITLTSTTSTSSGVTWNDGSQCFINRYGASDTTTRYTKKLYGQGYTITIQGPHDSSQGMYINNSSENDGHEYGGLINLLEGGAIYDLKVVISQGFALSGASGDGNTWVTVGGLVGRTVNAEIDNVSVTIQSGVRLAAFNWSSGGSEYARVGAVVGEVGNNTTITNVTVNNNGTIVAGTRASSGFTLNSNATGAVGNIVGWISANSGAPTLENLRVTGSGTVSAYYVGNIGVAYQTGAVLNINNFYNNFRGTYTASKSGTIMVDSSNREYGTTYLNVFSSDTTSSVGNVITTGTTQLSVNTGAGYTIYFDPTASNRANSMTVAFNNQSPSSAYTYTLRSGNGTSYSDYVIVGNSIVFKNMPTAAATWNSGGNFSATLNSELLFNPDTYENPLTKYEHGYTEGQTTSSGTAIATGEEWENIFAPSANGTPSGTYYLTNNIVINGFTGKEMSNVTIDGNGKTIFVIGATQSSYSGVRVGGLVGDFTGGTIKNVRVVYINSCSIASTGTNPRFGLVAGSVNGSKIENVQVYVESGVTISASKAGDNSVAMGGVVGYATNNSKFTNVTLDLNGTLAPTGLYQYLGGIVGLIDSANGATFTNIILRGAGTFAGTAGNTSGEPTYYGAVGVIMAASTNITSAYATIDGLIYDFDVTLAGTGGGSTTGYSCYYLFTNNYNAGASGGHKTDSPISGYEGGVTYSNIFVAEKYVSELEGFAGERTNGNAAVGIGSDTTIKKIAGEVTGVSGATVTAYFVPTGNNSDITLAASQPSGGWGGVSQLKSDGDSSAQSVDDGDMKVVTVAKANAATADNKVTLSEYVPGTAVTVTGVAPQLVYSAAEQGATFTFEGGSPELTTHYSVVYAVNDEDPKGAQLGDTGLPLNAGNYTATITLNEDSGFVFTSADGGYTRQTTFEFAVNPYELTLQSGIATALAGTYGDYTVTSGAVSGDKITSLTQETLFGSSVPGTVAYTITVADQSDGLLNASTYSFTAGVSDTNYNLASGAIDGVVVNPYRVEGTWALDGGLTLTYGDPFPSNIDQYISVALRTSTDIPGGLTSVTASGFTTDYTQGTAAGTTVNIFADTYAVNSGLTAGNYDFTGITGSGTVVVQKKTLNINPVSEEPDYMYDPHISAVYGATGDKTAVQAMLTWDAIGRYIEGNYNGEEVTFTIDKIYIAAYDEISSEFTLAGAEEVADKNMVSLDANSYLITVTADGGNYTVAEGQFFVYGVTPATLTVTGVTFEGGFNGVYDGQAHNVAVQYSGLVGSDVAYNFNITVTGVDGIAVTNAGAYTVTIAADEDNPNYDVGYENGTENEYTVTVEKADYDMTGVTFENASFKYDGTEKTITVSGALPTGADDIQVTVSYSGTNGTALTNAGSTEITATFATTSTNYNMPEAKTATLTITPVTLTINDISGNYTDYTAANIVIDDMVSGILEGDTEGVTITPAWDTPLADEDGWLAANTYNATLSLGGDKAVNYTFGSDNVATVTVSPFDLSGAQVTITSAPFTYNGNEQTILYTVLTGEGGKDITSVLTPTGNTQTNAGDNYTLTLTGGSNFIGSATVNWSIAKKDVTFAWSVSGEIVEGMAADEVKALATETNNGGILAADTYTFGVDIGDYSESTLKGTAVTFTPSVKFTEAGDAANYNITFSPETAQLTVQSSEIAIEVTQATVNTDYVNGYTSAAQFLANFTTSVSEVTIDESEFSVTVTPNGGAAVGFDSLLDVGEYTVTLTSSVYNNLTGTLTYDYVVTVTKWTASVAAPEGGLTYDGEDKLGKLVITPGDNAGAELEGAPEIAAYVEGGMINANAYTVTLRLQTAEGAVYEGGNFILAAASAEIEIAKRVVEISWAEDTDLIYNGTAHTLTATADFVSGESIDLNSLIAYTGDVTDGSAINAGSYTATITKAQIEEQNANYTLAAESVTQEFTISPATLTLTQAAGATLTRPYDGMVTEATSFLTEKYVTITGGVSGENIYGMLNASLTEGDEIKNAGAYTITVTFNSAAEGAGNYSVGDFTSLEIVYTVTAKTITITFDGYEGLTYNGQARTLTATADFVSGENIDLNALIAYTGDVTDGSAINAGDYTATITKAQIVEQNANYTLAAESATQEFTISPATLTLTQADGAQLSRVYDGTATEAGAFVSETYFTVDGYVDGGDKYALFTAAVDGGAVILNADSYTINITLNSGAEGAGNYTCETFAINYEVTPIQWTASVAAPEGGLTYDGEDKLGSLVITDDNEGTDIEGAPVIVATVTGGSMVNAGTYTVTLQLQTAEGTVYSGGNYKLTAESEEIEIAKRVVEIRWAEASDFTYNGLAHTLTATVNNKVGEDDVNAKVQLSGDNVKVTKEGFTYTVTGLTGEEAENYTIEGAENLTSETQYIARATLTVQFEGISGLVYTGTAHTVTATATGWQKDDSFDLNSLITIDGADTQVLNAGDYTATITKQALEEALGNYTLAQDATVEFTVAPATLNLTIEMKESGSGASVAKPFTWKVSGAVEVSKTADGWTLTSGGVSYNITVTGGEDVENLLNMLKLTLNGSEYNGTPYGTRVQEGKLAVASTDSNYKVEVTPVIINIEPDISIEIRTGEGYENTAVYNVNTTYTTADFEDYFYIDGQPEGTWAYSVEGEESGSFSEVGTYTVKATFTITASGIQLENHFTFTVTEATVTDVVLNGEGAYTYGDLTADSTVSVTVTYSDGNTATVNAGFEAAASTGGYVKAGESVELTLTGDDGKNANYAKVNGQTVTVSVSKAGITVNISYMDNSAVEGVLTLPYIGSEGYSNITVSLNGVLGDDVIYGMLKTAIINAGTYDSLEIALNGDDSGSYVITNAADLSVRVTPKEITVEWSNSEGFTYDGTAKTPTATAKGTFDNDEVTLTVTVEGDNATEEGQAINAGSYTATVAAFESGNYKLSEDSEQPFSIAKATATLGIENYQGSVEYNGSAVTVTPTINGAAAADGIVNASIAYTATGGTEAVSADEIRNAGSYTVTLQISGALNYEDASKDFAITVTPAELTVTTANKSFTYGDEIDLGATVNAISGDDVSAVIDRVEDDMGESAELKNAGSYTVTYRLEGTAAGNYKIIAGGSVGVTIGAKALTFTWNSDQTFTYNGAAQVPGYTLDGVVGGDEVTVTVTVTGGNETEGQAINAGVYTASVAEITKGNYSLTGVQTCSFTIGKANLTLTPDSVKFSDRDADKLSAYSKTNYEATIKTNVTVTGVGSDGVFNDFTVTTDDDSFTGENGTLTVGNYIFTVRVADGNYNDATYTVTVIEQTVAEFTAKPSSTTYTGGEITFTFANEEGIQLEEGVQITVSGITFNGASVASVLDAGRYTVTFAVTGNSPDNNYWYTVSSWTGSISPATVTANADTAVYGDVYTALETGNALQNGRVWQFVTFNGSPVEVTVTVTDATARAGETYLGADTYDVTVTLVSGNFTFAGGSNSVASTLQITRKQLNIAAQLPEDLTYTSEGIVIGLEDYASQLVGDDKVTVAMLVDGEPYVAGVTVLGAGQHTITVTMTDTFGNYQLAPAQQTFTVEKKEVTSSITVSGETIENNSSLEIVHGENARVQNAIDNYLTQNGVEEGEYTLTVTNSAGQAADLDNISAWAPGTYTVNLGLSDNFEGGMTFTIVVQEGTTAQIPDAPVLPSTPLEDGGSSGAANWLFPLIIAIECLIAIALIVAIVISAIKRGKNA